MSCEGLSLITQACAVCGCHEVHMTPLRGCGAGKPGMVAIPLCDLVTASSVGSASVAFFHFPRRSYRLASFITFPEEPLSWGKERRYKPHRQASTRLAAGLCADGNHEAHVAVHVHNSIKWNVKFSASVTLATFRRLHGHLCVQGAFFHPHRNLH